MHDNMMPMSPDDYKALSQYVSPRDIAAVVSICVVRPAAERMVQNRLLKPGPSL